MSIRSIIQAAAEATLLDEDGDSLPTEFDEPLTLEQAERYEARLGRSLPEAMRELLLFADGVTVGGIEIECASRQDWHDDFDLLAFHAWGNGDFDCLSLKPDSFGAVFFMNHSPAVSVRVAASLESGSRRCWPRRSSGAVSGTLATTATAKRPPAFTSTCWMNSAGGTVS